MGDERLYRALMATAIALTIAWVGWTLYDGVFSEKAPGDFAYAAGNRAFADGDYRQALESYDQALEEAPGHIHARRGRARALLQLGRHPEALEAFNRAIEATPEAGAPYANRGILHDRMGHYRKAVRDYEKALALDSDLADGPGWLTRFLRNQPEPPPTIADRAEYLKEQLALPESQRVLRVPEEDAKQRPYKM